jgi:hypothetical protein
MVWVVSLSTAELIPRGLTPVIVLLVFGVWFGEVTRKALRPIQYLYPQQIVTQG